MGTVFRSIREDPFVIDGLFKPKQPGGFCRMPAEVAKTVSPGVSSLIYKTAGGRVRFSTDASKIVLKADMNMAQMKNMTLMGNSGFDLYSVEGGIEHPLHIFVYNNAKECAEQIELANSLIANGKPHDYVLYLPLYTVVNELWIGLPEEATLSAPTYRYKYDEKPILYYGSSITQGASASRPGLAYEAIISRRLRTQFLNLGFSGNARAEDTMIDYLASLPDLLAFVCDYDHNTPSVEHLRNTHAKLYRSFRATHPDTPIVLVSAPTLFVCNQTWKERRAVILETYLDGLRAGDRNLHLVDGFTMMMDDVTEEMTIDGCHPNDLGFHRMAYAIGNTLASVLLEKERAGIL